MTHYTRCYVGVTPTGETIALDQVPDTAGPGNHDAAQPGRNPVAESGTSPR